MTNLELSRLDHREAYKNVYDIQAPTRAASITGHDAYYSTLRRLIERTVEPESRVLCIGSDIGQYLEWAKPAYGVGVEQSPALVAEAKRLHPEFTFLCQCFEELVVDEVFDIILVINCVNDFFDVQEVASRLRKNCASHTKVVVVSYNFLWQPLVELATKLKLKRPQPMQNWFTPTLLADIFHLAGFAEVRRFSGVLCPFAIPLIAPLFNRILAQLPLMHALCLIQATVFRPVQEVRTEQPSVSVIIPCKNERENIEAAVARMPRMGADMEIIFCDDHSDDGTGDRIREVMAAYPQWNIRLVQGPGICKAENVWTGFDAAQNDILMILDGDLAVAPEELTKFYDAIASNKGEFINGTRMIYPMRSQAMRLFNLFGNKMFSLLFSFILRQPISDTLCGTKVLWRKDYLKIKKLRGSWGVSDRWGDYEIIFGCAKLQLHYVEVPVHYLERTYGITKMNKRLHNAWIMLKMSLAAMRHFRFV